MHGDVTVHDRSTAARLGRYMIRCPLVLERLSLDEASGEVLYRTHPSRAAHPQGEVSRWDVYELIARVLDTYPRPVTSSFAIGATTPTPHGAAAPRCCSGVSSRPHHRPGPDLRVHHLGGRVQLKRARCDKISGAWPASGISPSMVAG